MDRMTEKRMLEQLLSNKRTGTSAALSSPAFLAVIWLLIAATFFAAFRMSEPFGSRGIIVVALSALAGMFGGGIVLLRISAKQWQTIARHVQDESVEARIRELERT